MPKFSLSKLNNKHFLSLAGNGILAVFGLAQFSLLYHSMSIEVAGHWLVFLNVISLCDAIRNGFLGTATVKFYAGTDAQRGATVIGSVWFLATALTGILLMLNLGGLFFLGFSNDIEVITIIKWLGLTFLSSLPYSVIFWILQADEDYGKILVLRLINNGSTITVFGILALTGKLTLETAAMYNFITNCFTSMVAVIWRFNTMKAIKHRSRESILELYHFGKFSLSTSLSSTLFRTADTFIVRFMLGAEAVAIYNIPSRLMEIVEIPLRSFVATGMSSMAVAFNNKNMHHVTYILKKYAGMLTIAFVPAALFVFVFADLAIQILGGAKYMGSEAANLYRLFMMVAILYPTDRFNGITLDIIHLPKINLHKTLIMLSVNIVADVVGIAIFHNIYGVVFAVCCSTFAGLLYGHFQLRKHVDYTIAGILSTGMAEMKQFVHSILNRGR